MSIQNHTFSISRRSSSEVVDRVRRLHCLSGYGLLRLSSHTQTLEVIFGSAWVTVDGEDVILQTGDILELHQSGDPVLVSSVQQKKLVLAVTQ